MKMTKTRPRLQRKTRIFASFAAFAGPSLVIILFLWRLPGWERQIQQIADIKERVVAQNEVFKTLLQLAGGSLLIAGFYFTWKTIQVSQEGQITDRFSKAIDHIGQSNMSIRLGGIYALARIASDSEKDAYTVVQVMAAIVRDVTSGPTLAKPAPDVSTIVALLGSGDWAKGAEVDFSGCNLRGLELENAGLQNWILKDADMSEANLQGSRFDGAGLVGADFRNANLRRCSFRTANLTAANLEGATLRQVSLQSAILLGAKFDNSSLFGANFEGATGAVRQQFESAIFDDSTVLPEFRTEFD